MVSQIPINVISKGDAILGSFKDFDSKIYAKLIQLLAKNATDGNVFISNEDLANVEDIINGVLKTGDYGLFAQNYYDLFDKLDSAIIEEQAKLNNLKSNDLNKLWKGSVSNMAIRERVKYDFLGKGFSRNFVNGIAEAVREVGFFNKTISEAVEILKVKLVDESAFKKYVNNTARDLLSQYDGAFNDFVGKKYEFKNLLFIGNLIKTSRPFCSHIINDFNGRISIEQMEKELDIYCPNGKPSQVKIDFNGAQLKRGSGMIEGTKIENISELKGGDGCRHRILYVR